MIPEIQAGITSAKASFDLLKAIKGISDATKINAAVIELQEHILSAQQALLDAQETINSLVKEKEDLNANLIKRKSWDDRRSQYQLVQIRPGLNIYAYKPTGGNSGPEHWACPKCFEEEKISILQNTYSSNSFYTCPNCNFRMMPEKRPLPTKAIRNRPYPRPFEI